MIRHEYETIYVTRPDLTEEDQTRIDDKLLNLISNDGGDLLVHESWGRRKLAYPIRRQLQGTYKYLHYVAPAELPQELERIMRLEDSLIRFLTVKLGENVSDAEEARTLALQAQERRGGRLGLSSSEDEVDSDDSSASTSSNTEN